MIKMSMKVDQFKRDFARYQKLTGRTNEDCTRTLALITGKALANKTEPRGLSEEIGNRFMGGIVFQIATAIKNKYKKGQDFAVVHNSQRRHGVVKDFDPYDLHLSQSDRIRFEEYLKKQKAKAGRMKAAWITAAESLGGEKIKFGKRRAIKVDKKRVPEWLKRHVGGKWGTSYESGGRLSMFSVTLVNKTPYIYPRLVKKEAAFADSIKMWNKHAKQVFKYYTKDHPKKI